jgi:aspartate kinase
MKVYKFGGASVRNADAVRNVERILKEYGTQPLVIVISAMGKTTNGLEDVLNLYWNNGPYLQKIREIQDYHFEIMNGLFPNKSDDIFTDIGDIFMGLELFFEKPLARKYDFLYDQVISYGEIISTKIVSAYLNDAGYANKWIDARHFVITDDLWREARIEWGSTRSLISRRIPQIASQTPVITQGFIGSTHDNFTTTLGREGSDFTASIFASALDAEEVVIWKDVPGILNADPKRFSDTVLFEKLSYQEAIEMTYYGAAVLHPKTIKPIQNKNIPLNVRSFVNPEAPGTIIRADIPPQKDVAIIILKDKQRLLSLSTKDFSFIAEENISIIFENVVKYGINVNLMHNTAISFLICVDEMEEKLEGFIQALENEFNIESTKSLKLLTVKNYREELISNLLREETMVWEQKSAETAQFVLRA